MHYLLINSIFIHFKDWKKKNDGCNCSVVSEFLPITANTENIK